MRDVVCAECHQPHGEEPVRPTFDDASVFVHERCADAYAKRTAVKPWRPVLPIGGRPRWRKRATSG